MLPHRTFFLEILLYIKTCILNHSIMLFVCFDFRSTNVGNSVIGTSRSEGSLLPYFYRFRCHYPLITQLRLTKIHNFRKKVIFVDDSTFPAFFSHHSDNAATPHARKKGCDDLLSYFDMCLDTSDV